MQEKFGNKAHAPIAWRRIASDLAAALERGDYAAGAALPPAQDVAQGYGVNRHTVRQAYLHLQQIGLVTVRQGRGAFANGAAPYPYRIGRRVSFRENIKSHAVGATTSILAVDVITADKTLADDLCVTPGSPLWRIDVVNAAGGAPLSIGRHHLDCGRFHNFPTALAKAGCSLTAAFRASGVDQYERRSTRISARMSTAADAAILRLDRRAALIVTRSIDASGGEPIQAVVAAFRADRIELLVEGS